MDNITLWNGDCLELMKNIDDASIDCIICDLPYGKTQNEWDSLIDLDKLWEQYNRIIKENGVIILFGQDKFTAKVMLSSPYHRYNLIWNKDLVSGHLNSMEMPLRVHEDIMIFYKKLPVYHPQKVKGKKNHSVGTSVGKVAGVDSKNNNYGSYVLQESDQSGMKYPTSILSVPKPHPSIMIHPTQKPVALIEWLLKSYTDEEMLVLDNCMGSGTTGVACYNLNRKFIGIELDEKYFEMAKNRIEKNQFNYMIKTNVKNKYGQDENDEELINDFFAVDTEDEE